MRAALVFFFSCVYVVTLAHDMAFKKSALQFWMMNSWVSLYKKKCLERPSKETNAPALYEALFFRDIFSDLLHQNRAPKSQKDQFSSQDLHVFAPSLSNIVANVRDFALRFSKFAPIFSSVVPRFPVFVLRMSSFCPNIFQNSCKN